MFNRITAGRFKGKPIKTDGDYVYIPFGSEHLNITNEIVDYIRMMSVEQSRSFLSGFLRGLLAKWLGNTTWLSAIQSAQAKSRCRIRIAYRDGTASVCVVDPHIIDQLAVTFDFL